MCILKPLLDEEWAHMGLGSFSSKIYITNLISGLNYLTMKCDENLLVHIENGRYLKDLNPQESIIEKKIPRKKNISLC